MTDITNPVPPGPSIPEPQPGNPGGVPPHFHNDFRVEEKDLIPNGSYIAVVPDWAAMEGSKVYYLNGTDFRIYVMLDGTWQVIRKVTLPLTESDLSLSDVTTLNVSTTKHGFVPKAPNDATKFLNGVGAFAVPAYPVTLKASGVASNANSITISSLDLNADEQYLAIIKYVNGNSRSAGTSEKRLKINADTGANYDYAFQSFSNNGGGARADTALNGQTVMKLNADVNIDADGHIALWITSGGSNKALLQWTGYEKDPGVGVGQTVQGGGYYNGAANITNFEVGPLNAAGETKNWSVYVYKYSLT